MTKQQQLYIYICIHICIYIWLWGYFIKGIVEPRVESKVPFFCLVSSYPWEFWARITLSASMNPYFLCWQTYSVFLIHFSLDVLLSSMKVQTAAPVDLLDILPIPIFYFLTSSKGTNFFLNVLVLDGLEPNWHPWSFIMFYICVFFF